MSKPAIALNSPSDTIKYKAIRDDLGYHVYCKYRWWPFNWFQVADPFEQTNTNTWLTAKQAQQFVNTIHRFKR